MARKKRNRWWLVAPGFLGVVAVVAFFGLQPLVDWKTRQGLTVFEGYTTTYERARLQPIRLNYRLTGVKIMKDSAGGAAEPFAAWDSLEFGLDWRELLHRHIVATLDVVKPQVHLIAARDRAQRQLDPEIPDFAAKLEAALPLKVARIAVHDGVVSFVDKTEPDFPRVWLHGIDATLENLATRAALAKDEPTILALSATAQKSAEVSAYITADPLAKGLFFSGRFRVANLELTEFKGILASETGLQFDRGTLEVFAEFDCRDGTLAGGVKPVIKNAHVVQGKPGLVNLVKTVLADVALPIFSDRVGGRDAVATVIPISGRVTGPTAQLWPTIIGVVRNAFVQGVSESFAHLPPPKAEAPQGVLPQLVNGLDKAAGPPQAQPEPKPTSVSEAR